MTFSCEECGKEFDSKRGLHIHQSQVHTEEEIKEAEKAEETSEEPEKAESTEKKDTTENNGREITIQIGSLWKLGAIFLAGILLGGLFMGAVNNNPVANVVPTEDTADDNRIRFSEDIYNDEPTLGDIEAPIKMIEVTDFGCPWCAEWAGYDAIPQRNIDQTDTLNRIKSNYVETGDVELVVKDYPAHPNAPEAHKAANCAWETDEDSYWDFHDQLFERRNEWMQSEQNNPEETFRSIANDLGLNADTLMQCVDNKDNSAFTEGIQQLQEGDSEGFGTPTFYIGNNDIGFVKVEGAQTYSTLEQVLDRELERAQ